MKGLEEVISVKKKIEKILEDEALLEAEAPEMIRTLSKLTLDLDILRKSKIGFTLDKLRKSTKDESIKKSAKDLLKSWKKMESGNDKDDISKKEKKAGVYFIIMD